VRESPRDGETDNGNTTYQLDALTPFEHHAAPHHEQAGTRQERQAHHGAAASCGHLIASAFRVIFFAQLARPRVGPFSWERDAPAAAA
jgi:hypothetical protein